LITLALIGLVGGLITGISPCVLPVLPVIFLTGGTPTGQQGRPVRAFRDTTRRDTTRRDTTGARTTAGRRPYLIVAGLALSFSAFTLLGTLVLSALPLPKDIIRWTGLVVLVVLGIAMLVPKVQEILERPFTWIPQRRVENQHGGFILGLALGAVYVPCAGPVLAAITVAGATGKIGVQTVVLTVAFAIGTSIPLLAFALAGRGVSERIKAFRTRQRGVRIAAGVVVIGLAVALTFNVTDALQRAVPDYTTGLNSALDKGNGLAKALGTNATGSLADCEQESNDTLQDCGAAPAISGIQQWFNTPDDAPITLASLKGKVTLIDFWAYSCINCQRAITHVDAWYSAYQADGLEVIGVHTPEYAFEHVASNVEAGAKRLGVTYPVALDNNYTTWNNFDNQSWPAEYLIDSTGVIRHVAIGEGDYSTSESLIRQLLTAANPAVVLPPATEVADTTPTSPNQTPETYLGSERASTFVGPMLKSGAQTFSYPSSLPVDEFALNGSWTVTAESITSAKDAAIELNFNASDVYLDIGGTGTVTAEINGKQSIYQISGAPNIYTVFHSAADEAGTLQVTLSPGLTAYSFTFG
jgi:cytochrome c biogenesis protein CcdA/thiol-disulfide isomerase/thioredoxin